MTINVEVPRVRYTGDGVQDLYTYTFTVGAWSGMVVTVDDVQQVEYSDYILQNETEYGGEVLFTVPPVDAADVLIERRTPASQQLDLEEFTRFPAESLESSLDKLTKLIQEYHSGIQEGDEPPSGSHPVHSVFSRLGHVLGEAGDYTAALIDYVNAFSGLNATDVQAAIDELHSNAGDHLTDTDNPHEVTHLQLPDRGTNDHAAIDVHIADEGIHGRYYEQDTTPSGAVAGSWWYDPS